MDTVRKVIGGIDKKELISGLVKTALAIMKSQKQITLKVAPLQVDSLNERLSEIIRNYPQINSIEIKGDERLSPGNLVMESRIGIVDAGIETQLTAIEAAFKRCFQPENAI
jgi:type III secretion protein L